MAFGRMHLACAVIAGCIATSALSAELHVYRNPDYGFSVDLPGDIKCETNHPPNPNHGFKIPVSADAFVWVDAGSSDDQTLAGAAETEINVGWHGCTEVAREPAHLAAKPAEKIMLSCPVGYDPGFDPGFARRQRKRVLEIVALEAPPGLYNTVYTIGAAYPENNNVEQRKTTAVFDVVRRGFRFNE